MRCPVTRGGDDEDEVTIRDKRHLRGTIAWALSLAALVFLSGAASVSLRGEPGQVLGALALLAIVAGACGVALNRRLRAARSQALQDPLTGLPNRVLLDDRIQQALRSSQRSGEPFTLILVDLDGFKDVNDVRGHSAGDAVLRSLARRFDAIVRSADTVARVGGDEFVILSLGTGNDEQAAALVGRLRHALRRPFRVEGAMVEIDGSIGWAVFPTDGATADELLARADGQMYATKRDSSDDALLLRRGVDAGVIRDVEAALQRNELMVLYQPILELATGEPRSAEALVRRVLPDGSLLAPAEFVPHVERTPLVRELTFLVVAEAHRGGAALGRRRQRPRRLRQRPVQAHRRPAVRGGPRRHAALGQRPAGSAHPRSRSRGPGRRLGARRGGARDASRSSVSGSRSTTADAPRRSPRFACSRSTS